MLRTYLPLRFLVLSFLAVFFISANEEIRQRHDILNDSSSCVFIEPPEGFLPTKEVAGCFCVHEGKILFLLRNTEKPQGKTWCIPGGKLEKGETSHEAVIREVKEETGLHLSADSLRYCKKVCIRFPENDFILHLFSIKLSENRPVIDLEIKEHSHYQWVTYEEALQLPLIPGGKECLCLALNQTNLDCKETIEQLSGCPRRPCSKRDPR